MARQTRLRRRLRRITERADLRRVQSAQASGMRSKYINFRGLSRRWARSAVRLDAKASRIAGRLALWGGY